MSKVAPKQAAIFIGILAVIALIINSTQHFGSNRSFTSQPVAVSQQVGPTDKGTASPITTADAAAAARRAAEEAAAEHRRYLARYLNSDYTRKPGIKAVALVVASDDGKFNRALSTVVADRFRTNSIEIVPSFFKPEFVSDGLFNDAFGDPREVIKKLELAKSLDLLLFARQKVRYSTNPSLENVITANMELEMAAFPAVVNAESRSWTFSANGAGFKKEDARLLAEERLIKQITSDTKMSLAPMFTGN